ncbi:MAG: fibronectin type III-like domain-contianing protein [Clostridiales bacterium]|nr:fibronectin type III-like domain-contianing protein [Clostridiales bacterium]
MSRLVIISKKGESVTVTFELDYRKLGFYDSCGNYRVEPGEFDVFVGTNCLTENLFTVHVYD